jgi:hypothetical protein
VLLAISALPIFGQTNSKVAPARNTDSIAITESGRKLRSQHGELAKGNFQIAGVDLANWGSDPSEDAFRVVSSVLGKIETQATGDAGDYDESACYRPLDTSDNTRLFFGKGEVAFYFTLASNNSSLKPRQHCHPSSKVYKSLATASGLHLGQTSELVIAILGLPTRHSHQNHSDFLVYDSETRKKTSAKDLARLRQLYPGYTEKELLRDYEFYDLSETIRVKFVDDQLAEITVVWIATN